MEVFLHNSDCSNNVFTVEIQKTFKTQFGLTFGTLNLPLTIFCNLQNTTICVGHLHSKT